MINLIFGIILSVCLGCIGGYYWSIVSNINVIYPTGAPRIASDFHSDIGVNDKQREKKHQGIDLTGRFGQPIIAAADGTVLETTVEKCWGPTISVDHGKSIDGQKIIALYGHLGKISMAIGSKIKRGEIIGRLGNNHYKFHCIGGV